MVSRMTKSVLPLLMLFLSAGTAACKDGSEYASFLHSHAALKPGMTLRQAFEAGLDDYLVRMGTKNVPGATVAEKQPISKSCKRHVLDIAHSRSSLSGKFIVRVFCGMNDPSSTQVIPERSYTDKQALLEALDIVYSEWARSMEFRVESPPRRLWGEYDHYRFTTDAEGKIIAVSPVSGLPSRQSVR